MDDLAEGHGRVLQSLGLTAGGVALRDGLLPATGPWPGLGDVLVPMAWADSVAIVTGADGGWRGFSAAVTELRMLSGVPAERRPRAVFTLVNGAASTDRTGLMVQRGGASSWLRAGALAQKRAASAALDASSDHLWFLEVGQRRGAHAFSGSFSQRGLAGGTLADPDVLLSYPPFTGFQEAARGESGAFQWAWQEGATRASVRLERSHDHRESYEAIYEDVFAEREAQDVGWVAELERGGGASRRGLRLELRQAEVRRSEDFLSPTFDSRPAVSRKHRSVWLAARRALEFVGGTLDLQLGAGHSDAPVRGEEAVSVAPSLDWHRGGPVRMRVFAERLLTPVWSDLAALDDGGAPLAPWMQSAWLAGLELGAGSHSGRWLEVALSAADTRDRAHLQPWPVRDIALRYGWSRDDGRLRDAQATVSAGLRHGAHAIEGEAFVRSRPIGFQGAEAFPGVGARAGLETGFRAFAGDLGLRLRVEPAWVGPRQSLPMPGLSAPPVELPGFVTWSASLGLDLGDARMVLRMHNLEDRPRPLPWPDPHREFPGSPAFGPGRQLRFELAWPLFN